MRSVHKILTIKPEGKRTLEGFGVDGYNIKMDVKGVR
jgi:hypothetical protein